jgi:hypothetical protein
VDVIIPHVELCRTIRIGIREVNFQQRFPMEKPSLDIFESIEVITFFIVVVSSLTTERASLALV